MMTIGLNEVPNDVLNGLMRHACKRACCTFTAILCCLPTMGGSAGVCKGIDTDMPDGCNCYYGCLSGVEGAKLESLQRGLRDMIANGNHRVTSLGENEAAVALDQANKTLERIGIIDMTSSSYAGFLADQILVIQEKIRLHRETLPLLGGARHGDLQQTIFTDTQPHATVTGSLELPPEYTPTQ